MPTQQETGVRPLESSEDFGETRLEAVGFIFHGILTSGGDVTAQAGG